MSEDFIVNAEGRAEQGKGASRRLRRANKVPAIIYGGKSKPAMIQMGHDALMHHLEHEAFYSHILTINVDGKKEQAVLKDVQRHPAKPRIHHVDFQRVVKGEKLKMNVPLHFIGEDTAPGVKLKGGVVQHLVTELEITVLPKDLPEFIAIDISEMDVDESVHLAEVILPEGVEISANLLEENPTVVSIHIPRVVVEVDEEEEAEAVEGDESEDEDGADSDDKKEEGKED